MESVLEKSFVCDFSLLLDYAYAHVALDGGCLDTFKKVHNEACGHLPPPFLLICLKCGPVVELRRIRARGRESKNSITIDYLASLNN